MGLLFQIMCTGIICTMGLNLGLIFAWPASTIRLFESKNTTLNRPMTDTEISFLGSLSSIGGMISTLIAGYLLDKIGRKRCAMITATSLVIFWSILTVSRQVEVVLFSVFISGTSSSTYLIASVYIGEICQESIRGAMTSANMVCYGMGMLLSYGLGGYLSYDMMLYVGLAMAIVCASLLIILKDSPTYLMKIGEERKAAEAIAFFRRLKLDEKEVADEINLIKRTLNPDLEDEQSSEHEKLNANTKPEQKLSLWQFMKKSRSTRRALLINLVLMLSSLVQGLIVVQIYVKSLFVDALPSASTTLCSMLLQAVVVVSGVVAAYLTDVAGRRPLIIYASIGTGISCIVLGTQMQLHWGPNWITAVFLFVFPVMYTFGAGTVPFVLLAELFLPEVKSKLSTLVVQITWTCDFLVLFIVNPLLKTWGWGVVFYMFGIGCFLTSAFCVFFLPETKGLTVDEIQPLLVKKKHRNHC